MKRPGQKIPAGLCESIVSYLYYLAGIVGSDITLPS